MSGNRSITRKDESSAWDSQSSECAANKYTTVIVLAMYNEASRQIETEWTEVILRRCAGTCSGIRLRDLKTLSTKPVTRCLKKLPRDAASTMARLDEKANDGSYAFGIRR